MRHRLLVAGIACFVATASAAGCSFGGSDTVEEVDPGLLGGLEEPTASTTPPGSSDPTTSSTTPGSTTTVEMVSMPVYFIQGSQLIGIDTDVPDNAELRQQLELLQEVPPDASNDGVRTAVPAGLVSGVARWGSDGVTVHLDADQFGAIDDSDQRLLVGQLVLTLTGLPGGIDRVDFTLDGEPLQVFRRDNTLGRPGEAVRCGDYDVLLADGDACTVDTSSVTTESIRSSVSLTSGP